MPKAQLVDKLEIEPYQLAAIIVGLLAVVGTAVAYMVKLSMRVKHLEEEIERNPILNALKQFEQSYVIKMLNDFITNRLEKKNG